MTYDEFIKKHNGVAVDFDGAAKAQCVDLATAYFYEVFNSKIKNFWFDAHHFWDLFDNNPWLKKNMTKIENKPETVPQKGDVVVFSAIKGHKHGHICMYDGHQWISDFKQRSMYSANAYRNNGMHTYWRRPDGKAWRKISLKSWRRAIAIALGI